MSTVTGARPHIPLMIVTIAMAVVKNPAIFVAVGEATLFIILDYADNGLIV